MHEPTITERLDWDDARMFLAVARAGQMLGASRSLGVNQATLSRRMAALEDRLEVVEDRPGLRLDALRHRSNEVERDLARGVDELAEGDGVDVGADGGRGVLGVDRGHAASSLLRTADGIAAE